MTVVRPVRRPLGLIALSLLCALAPHVASACIAPPSSLAVPYRDLVARTANIVLAETESAEPLPNHTVRYQFRTVKVLKGRSDGSFAMTFLPLGSRDTDFDRHRDGRFWDQRVSRQMNGSDCRMRPSFVVGARYLLFVDQPYHWRGFEKFEADDNRWLGAVTTVIATEGKRSGFSQTVLEYLADKRAVYVDRFTNCPPANGSTDTTVGIEHIEHIRGESVPAPLRPHDVYPFRNCRDATIFLTFYYQAGSQRCPICSADEPNTVPIRDGMADFSSFQTEIDIVGPKQVSLDDLRRAFH